MLQTEESTGAKALRQGHGWHVWEEDISITTAVKEGDECTERSIEEGKDVGFTQDLVPLTVGVLVLSE